ncbi:MAG: hypothetical protein OEY38_23030 [Gammaproteobacteria bacterium]|nr:hypothetical protein [Gammaproteobacteria bacterium]
MLRLKIVSIVFLLLLSTNTVAKELSLQTLFPDPPTIIGLVDKPEVELLTRIPEQAKMTIIIPFRIGWLAGRRLTALELSPDYRYAMTIIKGSAFPFGSPFQTQHVYINGKRQSVKLPNKTKFKWLGIANHPSSWWATYHLQLPNASIIANNKHFRAFMQQEPVYFEAEERSCFVLENWDTSDRNNKQIIESHIVCNGHSIHRTTNRLQILNNSDGHLRYLEVDHKKGSFINSKLFSEFFVDIMDPEFKGNFPVLSSVDQQHTLFYACTQPVQPCHSYQVFYNHKPLLKTPAYNIDQMVLSKDGGMYAFVYTQVKPEHQRLPKKKLMLKHYNSKSHNEIGIQTVWNTQNVVGYFTKDVKKDYPRNRLSQLSGSDYEINYYWLWPDGSRIQIPSRAIVLANDNTIYERSKKFGTMINTHPIIMGHYPHKIHPRLPLVSSVSYSGPGLSSWGNYVHGHNPYISNRLYVGNVMLEKEYDHYWPAYFHENENKFTYAAQKDLKIYRVTQSYIVIE